ncbi:MAG: iron ABC transporter permease [Desulfobacterota bacterium]|nr:iron ABC transporter permease [Thermodesulfobacteriota bacterium]MDW8002844.1 iron ABC transporter permease [Deltaproteobacteria bacterium]
MKDKKKKWLISIIASVLVLIGSSFVSLIIGPAGMIILPSGNSEETIFFDIRLPRVVLGFGAGGSLSLSGLLLQGIFKNPLMEPYTLGISGGAAFFVALGIMLGLEEMIGITSLPFFGFLGSLFVLFVIYIIASKRFFNKEEVLLSGVMISFISASLIMLFFALAKSEEIHRIIFWMMGTLQEERKELVFLLPIVALSFLFLSYLFSVDLNALQLGEEEASRLGVNVLRTKRTILLISSVLTGMTVSITGIIGFVGLVVPHIMRKLFGPDYRLLFFSSFFFGGAFLNLCDVLSRTIIKPSELPVGVITGIVGGSLFLYLIVRKK